MLCRIFSIALVLALLPLVAGAQHKDGFERERKEGDTTKNALEGKTPPELLVKDWVNTGGKALKLSDLKGKVVVLDFWGVWCPPCRAAMPHLKELYEKNKSAGLEVVGIHTTNQGEEMAKFAQEQSLPWPIAVDVDQGTVKAFKVDSYPDYYVIDKAGNLRVADLANKELDRVIEALLKE